MADLPAAYRPPSLLKPRTTAGGFMRAALTGIGILKRVPPKAGVSSRRIARPLDAERELSALARSPTVFGATTWRALSLASYALQVCRGFGIGGKVEVLDPEVVPWAGALLRLLQLPDPQDLTSLFPAHPGESMIAQVVGDLVNGGNAYVAPTVDGKGDIIGLTRLHPAHMSLERRAGEEVWVYKVPGAKALVYPRRTISHIHLLSWQASGQGEIGTGAGAPLKHLVDAEAEALRQTANVVRQGGVDIHVTGKSEAATAMLETKERREEVAEQVSTALRGGSDGDRRVMVSSGDFDIQDAGLKPADIRAPETLKAARAAELVALGTAPVMVGENSGSFSAAIQQMRVQLVNDLALVYAIEVALFRPLARHFASRAGGRWAARPDEVTCRLDLSDHPGQAYLRSEAVNRMEKWIRYGWLNTQAATIEGLEVPKPEGTVQLSSGGLPGAAGLPRPAGDVSEGGKKPAGPDEDEADEKPAPRKVIDLFPEPRLGGGDADAASPSDDPSRRHEA